MRNRLILPCMCALLWGFGSALASETATDPNASPDSLDHPRLEAIEELYQPYFKKLSAYKPTYFLVGANPSNSKFQFSFKYQLLGDQGSWAQSQPWVKGFHFAYTQTSFWDLKAPSAPFDDSSYKPELFYLTPNLVSETPWLRGLFMRTGLQHESNGRGGLDSRSTNFAYVKPMLFFYEDQSRLGFMFGPKVWLYVGNDDETNPDLSDYRGYFDLEFKFGRADGIICGNHVYWGDAGGSWQADLTYPLHKLFKGNLDLYLQVQYADVLAETLLDYRQRRRVWRIGFAIVR